MLRTPSKDREKRRFSRSPKLQTPDKKFSLADKENMDPQLQDQVVAPAADLTANFTSNESWILDAENSRKRKSISGRPSLGRRVSFSHTVEMRRFQKWDHDDRSPAAAAAATASAADAKEKKAEPAALPPKRASIVVAPTDTVSVFPEGHYEDLTVEMGNLIDLQASPLAESTTKGGVLASLDGVPSMTPPPVHHRRESKVKQSVNLLDMEINGGFTSTADLLRDYESGNTPAHMRTPSIKSLLQSLGDETMEISKTPSISRLLDEIGEDDDLTVFTKRNALPVTEEDEEDDMENQTFMKTPSVSRLLADTQEDEDLTVFNPKKAKQHDEYEYSADELEDVQGQEKDQEQNEFEERQSDDEDQTYMKTPSVSKLLADTSFDEDLTMFQPKASKKAEVDSYAQKEAQDQTLDMISAEQPISFQQFLELAGIQFYNTDDRKASIGGHQPKRSIDMKAAACFTACNGPELEALQWGCDSLKQSINDATKKISTLEQTISSENPPIFSKLRAAKGEDAEALRERLKQLRQSCTSGSKEFLSGWRQKLTTHILKLRQTNLELANMDADQLQGYISRLEELMNSMPADKERLLQHKREKDEFAGDITQELTGTMAITEVTPEMLDDLKEQKENCKILEGLLNWKVQAFTPSEMVLRFNSNFVLHLILGGSPSDSPRPVTGKTFGPAYGVHLDELYLGLAETADVNSLLNKLHSTQQLREVLDEVSFRLGRIDDLALELKKLDRQFTIRNKLRGNSRTTTSIEVEISNNEARSKFFACFDLNYNYPFGPLPFTFRNLFGNVSAHQVGQTIASIPEGFGRLTRTFHALKQIKM